jgi:hypothetical protein
VQVVGSGTGPAWSPNARIRLQALATPSHSQQSPLLGPAPMLSCPNSSCVSKRKSRRRTRGAPTGARTPLSPRCSEASAFRESYEQTRAGVARKASHDSSSHAAPMTSRIVPRGRSREDLPRPCACARGRAQGVRAPAARSSCSPPSHRGPLRARHHLIVALHDRAPSDGCVAHTARGPAWTRLLCGRVLQIHDAAWTRIVESSRTNI